VRRQVVLFAQDHAQAATGGIARNACAIDAAAYYQHIAINILPCFCHAVLVKFPTRYDC
jgi:hypothetical protein